MTALDGKAGGSGGTVLPTLDNPASATDILSGKEAIDGEGNKITGSIATKTSSDLTASGSTVTVPAGYYASNASKSVATVTQATPTVSVSASGLITASATQSAGYVASGTKSGTKQLTTKTATTYTPTTSNQTISSGIYLTGTQTIKGDANLKAENIASGVSIFGVAGTHSGSENLDTELTEQESLISELSTILDSKASGGSGGGSIETCTVTISSNSSFNGIWIIFYNSLENNSIIGKKSDFLLNSTSTITVNALQGSVITIVAFDIGVFNDYGMSNCSVSNGGNLLHVMQDSVNIVNVGLVIQLPNENDCTITCS